MMAAALFGLGAGAGLVAAGWGARRWLQQALLRGLRAPRVPHAPPVPALPLAGGHCEAAHLVDGRGRRLAAWLVRPAAGPAPRTPAVLVMHGWGANASMMWPVVPPLLAAGVAVLLVDARCHGDSDDEAFTSMPRFAEDIATGLRWLRAQPGVDAGRIALLGHSVGAAACLLYASAPGRFDAAGAAPPALRAVISLSAFAHPREVMRRWLAEHRLPYPVLGWAVLRQVQQVIGARFDDIAPLHTVARVPCPVLLVHGRDDDTVPFADALRLQAAAGQAELLAVGGGHDLREALAPHGGALLDFLHRSGLSATRGAGAEG